MSGIVGFWNIDGRPAEPAALQRMAAPVAHRGCDGSDRHVEGPFALLHHHTWVTTEELGERQPLRGADGSIFAMDGRLDNRDDMVAALGLPRSASDAACVVAAYARWGDAFAERLTGEYVFAILDPKRRRALLVRDALGVRPLYYFHRGSLLAFASEIKALLAHPDVTTEPSDEGLADHLLVGMRPLDERHQTCFAGISAVVPSHVVVVSADGATTRRYWDFDPERTIRFRSFDEYVEGFRAHFAEAIRRRMRGPRAVAVSVSGGLDSSSIFCQAHTLVRAGSVPSADVVGISYSGATTDTDEVRYQAAIERAYGVSLERFPIDPCMGFVGGADEQVRAVEAPFLDYMWGVSHEVERRAAARGARVLLSGHWGDQVLFSSAYLVDLFRGLRWRRLRRHLGEYPRWMQAGEARDLRRRFLIDLARRHVPTPLIPLLKWIRLRALGGHREPRWFADRLLRHAHRYASIPATVGSAFHSAQARALYIEARSKYHVQCLEWNDKIGARYGLARSFPFFDRDLLAFLMATPGDVHNRDGVPRALLRAAMRGVLPDEVRQRKWKADFTSVVNDSIGADARAIVGALSRDSLVVRHGFVDGKRLDGELAALTARIGGSAATAGWDLADLYGLERWLQVFFGKRQEQAS